MAKKPDDVGLAELRTEPTMPPAGSAAEKPDRTVTAHAIQTGNARKQRQSVNFGGPVQSEPVMEFSPEHNIAAMLHGWTAQKAATHTDFECDVDVYVAALRVANQPLIPRAKVGPRHTYQPLPAATSPYAPHAQSKGKVA